MQRTEPTLKKRTASIGHNMMVLLWVHCAATVVPAPQNISGSQILLILSISSTSIVITLSSHLLNVLNWMIGNLPLSNTCVFFGCMVLLHRTVLYNNVLLHRIIFKMRGVLFNKICFIAQNLKDQFCGGSACSNWRSMHNMNNSAVQSRCCASRRAIHQGVVQ